MWGFLESEAGFLGLRRNTYRSHPTCSPLDPAGDTGYESFSKILRSGPLAELVSLPLRRAHSLDRQKARGRSKVLKGYLYDTWLSMQAHRRALRSGGRAVYVVGNSLHGGPEKPYLIPTDLILASLGQMVGLHTEQVVIARPLQRRLAGNHFLRDSILVFRKP